MSRNFLLFLWTALSLATPAGASVHKIGDYVSKEGDTMTGQLVMETSSVTTTGINAGLQSKTDATAGLRRAVKLSHGSPAVDGNGVCIEFEASTTDTFGPQACGVRTAAGGLGAFLVRTGGATQAQRLRVENDGHILLGTGVNQSTFTPLGALFIAQDSSITTLGGDINVQIATITINGKLRVSSGTLTPASYVELYKSGAGNSILTNSNVSGALTFMPGKVNPQIIMGDTTTSGSGFLDSSSGRPLFINGLTTGTVTIGNAGVAINSAGNIDSPAGSTATFVNTIMTGRIFPQVVFSTQTAGGTSALVTTTCPALSFALTGGCVCNGTPLVGTFINAPSPTITVAGSMPTGWQCQMSGTACSAYATCSRIQK